MQNPEQLLQAPIPGMSLTIEPGSVPWEQPPKYTTIQEVADYYVDSFTSNPEFVTTTLDAMEGKVPLKTIADYLMTMNVMQGMHTVDVGFLVLPIITELLSTYADLEGIKTYLTQDDFMKSNTLDKSVVDKVINSSMTKTEEAVKSIGAPKGLMAKGTM
jgi:hypothetical protein